MSWSFSSGLHFMQILESKGDIGVFAHPKSQATAPKEFHFSTDIRLGPPSVADLFDKVFIEGHVVVLTIILSFTPFGQDHISDYLSCSSLFTLNVLRTATGKMCLESPYQTLSIYKQRFVRCQFWRDSWHFTSCLGDRIIMHPMLQERGHLKEQQLEAQLLQKKTEEEKARVYKANPYPYSTDYPVVCENFTLDIFSRRHLLIHPI